jgi:F0F1-type ATP synthase delta subunit
MIEVNFNFAREMLVIAHAHAKALYELAELEGAPEDIVQSLKEKEELFARAIVDADPDTIKPRRRR